ncbi:NAD(P)/FAD-dependent oxidoreductase [Methylophilus medardicus]|uniref:FAD-dependent oxidoreductase n=1 Tax=Methylophilus medardicus TaxID=2588534 RepID=A0A5B8CUY4_9PROT|nr:FAD-dependent oxidoreductase [Methylophilus medardicus]QDC45073.1 FAD-dependent oxidoreductase [Methylophilus medardicus]QDC50080.1 FAD-dependent oxidoreductase [Methylophilus medardicus]QDC53785.1 FAD-dependent oxidoreductase [Methylophilus medardicus]
MANSSVVVVGGGIVGCLTAMQLRQQGHAVTVVERNVIAAQTSGESSWAGAGIAFPLLPWFYQDVVNSLALAGARAYPAVSAALFDDTGIDPECTRSGMRIQPPYDLERAKDWCQRFDLAYEVEGDALLIPEVLQIRNPRLLQALKAWLIKHGVTLREQTQLMPLQQGQAAIQGWPTTTGDTLVADVFVVTSGAWSFELLKHTALQLDVKPMRGQMLLYQMPPGLVPHILYREGFYMLQRRDGHLLAGSSLEDVGFDSGVTESMRLEMLQKAEAMLPALRGQPIIQHWSGLRPGTPHNIPTIGQHPQIENLYLNTGHFRYGVTMAPECARQIAALLA